jgi:DNA-binding NarL/FixJ family response regulator
LSDDLYIQKSIHDKLLNQQSSKPTNNGLNIKLTRREHDVLVGISEELATQQISENYLLVQKQLKSIA